MSETVTIPRRFNGPPDSGQGGWSAGLFAALVDAPAAAELRAPPPLDTPMAVERDGDEVRILDGETLVGRVTPVDPAPLEAPTGVGLEQAAAASVGYPGFEEHAFPTCFVCGPQRAVGDGLRIFPGPSGVGDVWAAMWTPDDTNSDDGETVAVEQVWAALDCPSYWCMAESAGMALMARLAATIGDPIPLRQPLIVLGWPVGQDGRKITGASALVTPDGSVLARADALWIQLKD